jgi:hypothetical protein
MATICVQVQPDRAPELGMKDVRSALESIGATPRLVQRHWVEEGLHFTFETLDPAELWGLIEDELFREPPWGRLARKASIVTCDGLILHHFDPAVARDPIPEMRKGKKTPRCG